MKNAKHRVKAKILPATALLAPAFEFPKPQSLLYPAAGRLSKRRGLPPPPALPGDGGLPDPPRPGRFIQ